MAGQWTEQLYAHLNKNPFQKKILITNRFAQGHQWLEQACRSYGPLMNTDVQTVESLVLASVKHELAMRLLHLFNKVNHKHHVLIYSEHLQLTYVEQSS